MPTDRLFGCQSPLSVHLCRLLFGNICCQVWPTLLRKQYGAERCNLHFTICTDLLLPLNFLCLLICPQCYSHGGQVV